MQKQVTVFTENILSLYLCSFKKRLQYIADIDFSDQKMEKKLDQKGYGGEVLMDLSKAFDTLNRDLLLAKWHAYGFDRDSLKVLHSYLSN